MAQSKNGYDGHEVRLNNLEERVSEVNEGQAIVQTDLKNLSHNVDRGFESLGQMMAKSHNQHESIVNEIRSLQPRIDMLETNHKRSVERMSAIRKAAIPLLIAACGGALATKFGGAFGAFLTALLGP